MNLGAGGTGVTPYAYTIFQQPWWLDAVAPRRWAECRVERDGNVVARLPYVVRRRHGLTLITQPPLTQALGPWISSTAGAKDAGLDDQRALVAGLIEQLPRHDYFTQACAPVLTDWLPFHWQGFDQRTLYTYVLDDLRDLDRVWAGLRKGPRRYIRKAQKTLSVRDDLGIDVLHGTLVATFERQGLRVPWSLGQIERLERACAARNSRRALFAVDAADRVHAAVYLVHDANVTYYLLSGAFPELRSSGAQSLLVWEGIRFAATVSRCFDFEGSMIEPIERFFRSFGARQVPYFRIHRMSRRMSILMGLRTTAEALLARQSTRP